MRTEYGVRRGGKREAASGKGKRGVSEEALLSTDYAKSVFVD